MEKQRRNKLIIIVALLISVVGMSIGFAVFSNVLIISSSATVTPSEDDFKITVYGVTSLSEFEAWNDTSGQYSPDFSKWSTNTSYQIRGISNSSEFYLGDSKYYATISDSNNKIIINNLVGNFTEPSQAAFYLFMIKNDGLYDAYFSVSSEFI